MQDALETEPKVVNPEGGGGGGVSSVAVNKKLHCNHLHT